MLLRSTLTALLALALIGAAGCDRSADSTGFVKPAGGNVHHNDKFGLTVTSPKGWYVMNFDQTSKMMDTGIEVSAAGNERLKGVAEAAKQKTATIFTFFRLPPGSPVDFNPSVMGAAEDVSLAPGVETGKDYFFHARKLMEASNVPYQFENGYKQRTIGGQVFDEMDLHVALNGQRLGQSYYAARHGGSVVLFITSYKSEDDRKETDAVISSIILDWK